MAAIHKQSNRVFIPKELRNCCLSLLQTLVLFTLLTNLHSQCSAASIYSGQHNTITLHCTGEFSTLTYDDCLKEEYFEQPQACYKVATSGQSLTCASICNDRMVRSRDEDICRNKCPDYYRIDCIHAMSSTKGTDLTPVPVHDVTAAPNQTFTAVFISLTALIILGIIAAVLIWKQCKTRITRSIAARFNKNKENCSVQVVDQEQDTPLLTGDQAPPTENEALTADQNTRFPIQDQRSHTHHNEPALIRTRSVPNLITVPVLSGQQCTESNYADTRPLPLGNNTDNDNHDGPGMVESEAQDRAGIQATTNHQAQDNSSRTMRYNMDARRQPSAVLQRTRSVPDFNLMLLVPAGVKQNANGFLQANIPAAIASLGGMT